MNDSLGASPQEQLRSLGKSLLIESLRTVSPEFLMRQAVRRRQDTLWIADSQRDLKKLDGFFIFGAGKAVSCMAAAFARQLAELEIKLPVSGLLIAPSRDTEPVCDAVEIIRIAPDYGNQPTPEIVRATQRMCHQIQKKLHNAAAKASTGHQTLGIGMFSGGGSALLCWPLDEISLQEYVELSRAVQNAGADIQTLNMLRSQLCHVKAGGLNSWLPQCSSTVALYISDVVADPGLAYVASGPTIPSHSPMTSIAEILQRVDPMGERIPKSLRDRIQKIRPKHKHDTKNSILDKTPNLPISDISHGSVTSHKLAGNEEARLALQKLCEQHFAKVITLPTPWTGEAKEIGLRMARHLRENADDDPFCVVGGGEAVVAFDAKRSLNLTKGGRNQETGLAFLVALQDWTPDRQFFFASMGTDGEDGPTDAAGAIIDELVLQRSKQTSLGLDLATSLRSHDSYVCLDRLGGLLRTGRTDTNVADLYLLLVGPKRRA